MSGGGWAISPFGAVPAYRHSKLYIQGDFHCSQFCAQMSFQKLKKYLNMCTNEYPPK